MYIIEATRLNRQTGAYNSKKFKRDNLVKAIAMADRLAGKYKCFVVIYKIDK